MGGEKRERGIRGWINNRKTKGREKDEERDGGEK